MKSVHGLTILLYLVEGILWEEGYQVKRFIGSDYNNSPVVTKTGEVPNDFSNNNYIGQPNGRTKWLRSTSLSHVIHKRKSTTKTFDVKHKRNADISKLHNNTSSAKQMSLEVLEGTRQKRNAEQTAKQPSAETYYFHHDNLWNMILDFAEGLEMRALTVFVEKKLAKRLARHLTIYGAIKWRVYPCPNLDDVSPPSESSLQLTMNMSNPYFISKAYASLTEHDDYLLIVALCQKKTTVALLREMVLHLNHQVWLTTRLDVRVSTDLYIPVDSMVITFEEASDASMFFLKEIWAVAKGQTLKQSYLGTWHANNKGDPDVRRNTRQTILGGTIATTGPESVKNHTGETISSSGNTRSYLSLTATMKYERRGDLTGIHFIVTYVMDPRASFIRFDKTQNKTIVTGFFGDVWEVLRHHLNFTYSIRTPDDGEYGRLYNGSWTGLVGDILNNRADVIIAFISHTYERSSVIDYCPALLKFSYRIFAKPLATGSTSWTSYTRPFSFSLWLTIAAVFFGMSASIWSLSYGYVKLISLTNDEANSAITRSQEKEISESKELKRDSLFVVCAAFTQQGWSYTPSKSGLQIIFWTSYVLGVMLLASYSATLISFLAVTGNNLKFDSLADLVALGNYRLGILKGSSLEELFKTPDFEVYQNALVRPYKDTIVNSYAELRANALADSKYGYIGSYEIQRLDYTGACIFRSARQHLLFNDGSMAWAKGFPYGPLLKHYVSKMRETGLLYKIKRRWYPEPFACQQNEVVPLDFNMVFTAFVILSLGMALGAAVVIVERLYARSDQTPPQKMYKNLLKNELDDNNIKMDLLEHVSS